MKNIKIEKEIIEKMIEICKAHKAKNDLLPTPVAALRAYLDGKIDALDDIKKYGKDSK